jgi:seryl-tRNA synthetase
MLDLKWIRENPDALDAALARRKAAPLAAVVVDLDRRNRATVTELQALQSRRNEVSKQIGGIKAKGGDAGPLMAEVAEIKDKMTALEAEGARLGDEVRNLLLTIPNVLQADVPDGADETGNVEIRRWGTPGAFDFKPKDHADLGTALGLMDFNQAAVISGARFVILKGPLARLERAIAQFMLDTHTAENGYTEINPPVLVKAEALVGTSQLPKFEADLFRTTAGLYLIPTAEVSLTNMVADRIVEAAELPMRVTAFTPCFRSEAGAAGKDTKGMIRQHQFEKVELVSIVAPEESAAEHERMTACAAGILEKLQLPHRVMALCAGDIGFGATRTYDIEVWLPGQDTYREISSCSNTGDFQARRMNARCRPPGESKGTRFVHTLNGSGLAVGRTLVAILENYQQADGSIRVPDVLLPYMGGLKVIGK